METAKMIDELEVAFNKANLKWWDGKLPKPMIIVSRKSSKWELGFITTSKVWTEVGAAEQEKKGLEPETRYEINISAEGLYRPMVDIVATLIHEMVHLYHLVNNIKDCSQKIHNKNFKKEAERVGLIVTRGTGVGYGCTDPSEELKQTILSWRLNEDVFKFVRQSIEKDAKPKKGSWKYTLPSDSTKHFKCKYRVTVCDTDTGEIYERSYVPGDDEEENEANLALEKAEGADNGN